MYENLTGYFVKSLAGHDKCAVYIVVGCDNKYVYISDGKNRLLSKPKRKKYKHIQLIKQKDSVIENKLNNNIDLINEDIKRAIKLYVSKI